MTGRRDGEGKVHGHTEWLATVEEGSDGLRSMEMICLVTTEGCRQIAAVEVQISG